MSKLSHCKQTIYKQLTQATTIQEPIMKSMDSYYHTVPCSPHACTQHTDTLFSTSLIYYNEEVYNVQYIARKSALGAPF